MNEFSRRIISAFQSSENLATLDGTIRNRYGANESVAALLPMWVRAYVGVIESEIKMSTFITHDVPANIAVFNDQFISDHEHLIASHAPVMFGVCEDQAGRAPLASSWAPGRATRESADAFSHARESADDMLERWKTNSGYKVGIRDDHQGDDVYRDSRRAIRDVNPELTFCDQSEVGRNRHVDMLSEGLYWQTLNGPNCPGKRMDPGLCSGGYIGDNTVATDRSLLDRRIFNTEGGRENGIHRRQKMLHRRNIERDISESLSGRERGCIAYNNQQSALIERVQYLRRN